jgi:hypothetical protein
MPLGDILVAIPIERLFEYLDALLAIIIIILAKVLVDMLIVK